MAVPIRIDANGVNAGTPVPLFTTHVIGSARSNYARSYTVARDGQRFLVDTFKEVTIPVTVILNLTPKP